MQYPLLLEYVYSQPWMTDQPSLDLAIEILCGLREGTTPLAVAEKQGRAHDATPSLSVRDGVGILEVTGPIFRRANLFTKLCGGTTTGQLAQDLRTAMDDPTIKGVLLNIDSPGGEANGIGELAGRIHAARDQKPVVAYAANAAASAAYYLASGASEIVAAPMAQLGSIGVIMPVTKPSPSEKRAHIEYISNQSPLKRPDPGTETGRHHFQDLVDQLGDVFVRDVAKFRKVKVQKVLDDFGQGAVKVGQAAVSSGLADRLGNFEDTLSELSQRAARRRVVSFTGAAQTAAQSSGDIDMGFDLSWLRKQPKAVQDAVLNDPEATVPEHETELKVGRIESVPDPRVAELLRKVDEMEQRTTAERQLLEARLQAQQLQALETQADLFLDGMVRDKHMLPAEKADAREMYLELAQNAQGGPLLEKFKKTLSSRPKHTLFDEQLGDDVQTEVRTLPSSRPMPVNDPNKPPSKEKTEELLGCTDLGQSAIAHGAMNKYNGRTVPKYPSAPR